MVSMWVGVSQLIDNQEVKQVLPHLHYPGCPCRAMGEVWLKTYLAHKNREILSVSLPQM
ncbi:hypothetical protein [uncultured Microscilla sp.]|uniref:hypothetical protein n=1 Tax=uncultured Microscilla sp. TaxID=432653 RepID=UPI002620E30E|nr:hypothetical protein [uncultured Microscilla sp.]